MAGGRLPPDTMDSMFVIRFYIYRSGGLVLHFVRNLPDLIYAHKPSRSQVKGDK